MLCEKIEGPKFSFKLQPARFQDHGVLDPRAREMAMARSSLMDPGKEAWQKEGSASQSSVASGTAPASTTTASTNEIDGEVEAELEPLPPSYEELVDVDLSDQWLLVGSTMGESVVGLTGEGIHVMPVADPGEDSDIDVILSAADQTRFVANTIAVEQDAAGQERIAEKNAQSEANSSADVVPGVSPGQNEDVGSDVLEDSDTEEIVEEAVHPSLGGNAVFEAFAGVFASVNGNMIADAIKGAIEDANEGGIADATKGCFANVNEGVTVRDENNTYITADSGEGDTEDIVPDLGETAAVAAVTGDTDDPGETDGGHMPEVLRTVAGVAVSGDAMRQAGKEEEEEEEGEGEEGEEEEEEKKKQPTLADAMEQLGALTATLDGCMVQAGALGKTIRILTNKKKTGENKDEGETARDGGGGVRSSTETSRARAVFDGSVEYETASAAGAEAGAEAGAGIVRRRCARNKLAAFGTLKSATSKAVEEEAAASRMAAAAAAAAAAATKEKEAAAVEAEKVAEAAEVLAEMEAKVEKAQRAKAVAEARAVNAEEERNTLIERHVVALQETTGSVNVVYERKINVLEAEVISLRRAAEVAAGKEGEEKEEGRWARGSAVMAGAVSQEAKVYEGEEGEEEGGPGEKSDVIDEGLGPEGKVKAQEREKENRVAGRGDVMDEEVGHVGGMEEEKSSWAGENAVQGAAGVSREEGAINAPTASTTAVAATTRPTCAVVASPAPATSTVATPADAATNAIYNVSASNPVSPVDAPARATADMSRAPNLARQRNVYGPYGTPESVVGMSIDTPEESDEYMRMYLERRVMAMAPSNTGNVFASEGAIEEGEVGREGGESKRRAGQIERVEGKGRGGGGREREGDWEREAGGEWGASRQEREKEKLGWWTGTAGGGGARRGREGWAAGRGIEKRGRGTVDGGRRERRREGRGG
eukprot:jgi/Undpi1/10634/HiC_scaffold_29.g13084.m1